MKKNRAPDHSMASNANTGPEPDITMDTVETVAPECPGTNESGISEPADSSLNEQLRELEQKITQYHDSWLRAKAETENIKRRSQEEVSKAHRYAIEKFAGEMLAVKDSLEAAYQNADPAEESVRSGLEITLKQFQQALERSGVCVIDPQGEKFDPNWHQAISMVPSDQEPNTVVQVLQKGYSIYERVLRPAMVIVAAGK